MVMTVINLLTECGMSRTLESIVLSFSKYILDLSLCHRMSLAEVVLTNTSLCSIIEKRYTKFNSNVI